MNEESVAPGEIATFQFVLSSFSQGAWEKFELVIDGLLWLPQTLFSISADPPRQRTDGQSVFAATMVGAPSVRNGIVEVRFENSGMLPWEGRYRPCIATTGPRDRISKAAAPGWLSQNRSTMMNEDWVEPGETACFEFELGPSADQFEEFELVIDGLLWLPQTSFGILADAAGQMADGRSVFAAAMVGVPSVRNGRVEVRFENSGMVTWEGRRRPSVGTTGPRDRPSPSATPSWLSENRPTSMREDRVEPGQVASFQFELGALSPDQLEEFELVIDGLLWFPETLFSVRETSPEP